MKYYVFQNALKVMPKDLLFLYNILFTGISENLHKALFSFNFNFIYSLNGRMYKYLVNIFHLLSQRE